MRVLAAVAALTAAFAGVEASPTCTSCRLYDIPESAICGAQGWRTNGAAPWFKQTPNVASADACIKSCTGGCVAVAYDLVTKYCNLYTKDVASFGLSGTSNVRYFDRSCSFGTSAGAVCGQNGHTTQNSYFEKTYNAKEDCQLLCRLESQCKSTGYNTETGKCVLYKAALSGTFTAAATSPNVFYDHDCYEC